MPMTESQIYSHDSELFDEQPHKQAEQSAEIEQMGRSGYSPEWKPV